MKARSFIASHSRHSAAAIALTAIIAVGVTACADDAATSTSPTPRASENSSEAPMSTNTQPALPESDLLQAAAAGDIATTRAAIDSGTNLEARDEHQRTPLLLAVTDDRVEVAQALVAAGADPNALDDRHDTPFLVTGVTGNVAMLQTLLPADPDLTIVNRFGGIAIIPASERGHVDYVRAILADTDINPNHINDLGWTALLEAIVYGDGSANYQEIVTILIAGGADVNIVDSNGQSPLSHAYERGHDEVARILVDAGAYR